jgi:exosome complex RNA-binding protein Csl4
MMKTRLFNMLIALSMVAALTFGISTTVKAEGVELGNGVVITAEVVAVDRMDRTVALLGPEGNVVAVEVGPQARNFDQIEVGDMVKAKYYESIALYLGKKGEKMGVTSGVVAARSAKGDMPAGAVVETVDVSAEIKSIDKKKRAVTLILPDGKNITTEVDKSVRAFDTLKVGDSVNARYTEATAISVERP